MPRLASGTALNISSRDALAFSLRSRKRFLCVAEAITQRRTTLRRNQSTCPTTGAKKHMSIDDFKNGQRINCNGVYGTVVGKRSTRNRRLVLVKMDNGFTLKLNPHSLSVRLPETGAIAQSNNPTKQLASVD
jgi:hypothetical protein